MARIEARPQHTGGVRKAPPRRMPRLRGRRCSYFAFSRASGHTTVHTSRWTGPIHTPAEMAVKDAFLCFSTTSHSVWGHVVADIPDFNRELVAALAAQ